MLVRQLSVKLFFADGVSFDEEALIPIFHRWIRDKTIKDELLIDVGDYRHVPEGPGVMIIGDRAHYSIDSSEGELGLRFSRKRDEVGEPGDKLEDAFAGALFAATALEGESTLGGARFRSDRVLVQVVSRLEAGNDDATHAELDPAVEAFAKRLFDRADVEDYARVGDARAPFGVLLEAPGKAGRIRELSAHLG